MNTTKPIGKKAALCGIGIDIENVDRFGNLPYSHNALLYKKIFSPQEIRYCTARRGSAMHFTARFAAKEAAVKAVGVAKDLRAFEIRNGRNNQPRLETKAFPHLDFYLSLAHTREYAVAVVVAFRR